MKINNLGNRLAVSSIDYGLSIYNIHPDNGLTHLTDINASDYGKQYHDIGKVDFNPTGDDELLTGILSLKTVDLKSGTFTKEFGMGSKAIQALAYAPNGLLCASGTIDGTVQVYDTRDYELKKTFSDHSKSVRAVKFSQNSQTLVSAGEDCHINLTDVETLTRKLTVPGHSDWITSLSVNSHVKSFISGSLDKTVKIWDLNSGKCTKTIAMKAPVWGVAFSPTGEYMMTACQDGTISIIAL